MSVRFVASYRLHSTVSDKIKVFLELGAAKPTGQRQTVKGKSKKFLRSKTPWGGQLAVRVFVALDRLTARCKLPRAPGRPVAPVYGRRWLGG